MDKDIFKGIKIGIGFFLVLSIIGVVFAGGYHVADEILSGTFSGNYEYTGDVNFSSSNVSGVTDRVYSITDDLSDINVYEDGSSSGTVTLVDVSGSGRLIGGVVAGHYMKDVSNTDNYQVTITIDGNTFDFPFNTGEYSYVTDANSNNHGTINLPPIKFDSNLKIEYVATGNRVWGSAYIKQ